MLSFTILRWTRANQSRRYLESIFWGFSLHIFDHGGILSTFCYFETLGALDRHFLVLIHLIAGGRRKRQVVDGHHLHLDNATEDAFLHGNTHMNLIIYLHEEKSEFMTT